MSEVYNNKLFYLISSSRQLMIDDQVFIPEQSVEYFKIIDSLLYVAISAEVMIVYDLNAEEFKELYRFFTGASGIAHVVDLIVSGTSIVFSTNYAIYCHETVTGKLLYRIGRGYRTRSILGTGEKLYVTSPCVDAPGIQVYDLKTGKELYEIKIKTRGEITCLFLQGTWLYVSNVKGNVFVLDLNSERVLREFVGINDAPVAFSYLESKKEIIVYPDPKNNWPLPRKPGVLIIQEEDMTVSSSFYLEKDQAVDFKVSKNFWAFIVPRNDKLFVYDLDNNVVETYSDVVSFAIDATTDKIYVLYKNGTVHNYNVLKN
jgi:hypothetical protein